MKKNWLAIACAAALTVVGTWAVDAATIQNGRGESVNLPAGVTATDLNQFNVAVKADRGHAVNEAVFDKKFLAKMNDSIRTAVNKNHAADSTIPEYKGDAIQGVTFYQLQGTDADGHHVGYALSMALNKDIIASMTPEQKASLAQVMDSKMAGHMSSVEVVKANQDMAAGYAAELDRFEKDLDAKYQAAVKAKDKKAMKNLAEDKAQFLEVKPFMQLVSFDLSGLATEALPKVGQQSNMYDIMAMDFVYDGFSLPWAVSDIRQDNGQSINVMMVFSIDASRPYWASVLKEIAAK